MPIVLFLMLLAIPLIELALIIKVGQTLGFWMTIGLLFGMAALGTALLNRQGISAMRRASESLAAGRPPVGAAVDGLFLGVAALLLITPGFLSDILGLLLLIPPLRRLIASTLLRKLLDGGTVVVYREEGRSWPGDAGGSGGHRDGPSGRGVVIETEYERVPDPPKNDRGRNP